MKTIFVLLFLLCFFIISIPIFFILFLIGKINPYLKVKYSQAIVVFAFNIILKCCGIKKTIIGAENIPKDQPVLYVSNHRSYFDVLVAYTSVTSLTGFVAKKEIEKVPFLRVWMRNLNCLFIDRENVREGLKTILKGVDLVKNGYSIFISPEGTRNHGTDMLPFKEGSFKIAEKSGCPIIPVSLSNTDEAFENHFPWIRKAHVIIEFGKPVHVKELDKEHQKFLGAYVQNIIKESLDKNAKLV
ncbi:1-acyl-sn-glycerol-3-phosphate acyltransferase [Mobilisporobacter senegalensis]|uniref:1-acyl-sn-glycerol-3-phosphate acyltransferase n=1 Tax=Mobilisporobacter senegalensis TaxID=1329262 RepID=A0A3N1XI31_9FIRM|nr:lysophospholipid acyltransferase family protein [Mobilisporobacter senegalensis]ROR25748.1 1-acyl-sn-glycerol-3-phosphate acyltransferase [Mobilisporobacter senegalensis]